MDIKIEQGVPVPESRGKFVAIWRAMEPGDSALFEKSDGPALRYSLTHFVNRVEPEWKFTTRSMPEGLRVWRVK